MLLHQVVLSRHTVSFPLWTIFRTFANLFLHVASIFTPDMAHVIDCSDVAKECPTPFLWWYFAVASQCLRIEILHGLLFAFATISNYLLILYILISISLRYSSRLKRRLHDHFLKLRDIGAINKGHIILLSLAFTAILPIATCPLTVISNCIRFRVLTGCHTIGLAYSFKRWRIYSLLNLLMLLLLLILIKQDSFIVPIHLVHLLVDDTENRVVFKLHGACCSTCLRIVHVLDSRPALELVLIWATHSTRMVRVGRTVMRNQTCLRLLGCVGSWSVEQHGGFFLGR